jgi:hypothetical protein
MRRVDHCSRRGRVKLLAFEVSLARPARKSVANVTCTTSPVTSCFVVRRTTSSSNLLSSSSSTIMRMIMLMADIITRPPSPFLPPPATSASMMYPLAFVVLILSTLLCEAVCFLAPVGIPSKHCTIPPRVHQGDTWQSPSTIQSTAPWLRTTPNLSFASASTKLSSGGRRLEDEIEENSRRRASRQQQQQGASGIGETAAGAILGGLLLGPFGASARDGS